MNISMPSSSGAGFLGPFGTSCTDGKAVKYFVLGKLALTREKRLHYRDKLARYIAL